MDGTWLSGRKGTSLDQLPSCFSVESLLGSKFVTNKNEKMKEHSQSSEIQGVLSYARLKDGQVAKLETQK